MVASDWACLTENAVSSHTSHTITSSQICSYLLRNRGCRAQRAARPSSPSRSCDPLDPSWLNVVSEGPTHSMSMAFVSLAWKGQYAKEDQKRSGEFFSVFFLHVFPTLGHYTPA